MALAPDAAVDELSDLADLARERLIPRLLSLAAVGPTWLNPTFAGSSRMAADGDVVTGHLLLELKTVLGRKTAAGRKAALDGLTLFQLLGYVLHDHDDGHGITAVGLYQARYGHLAVWPLRRLLPELAGGPVDLPSLWERWRSMLDTGKIGPARLSAPPARIPTPTSTRVKHPTSLSDVAGVAGGCRRGTGPAGR